MVIGLTVVAIGTSAPELVVSMRAAFGGSGSIAMGNVIGSNICNILLVLGCASIIRPLPVQRDHFRFDIPALLISSALLMIVFYDLSLSRIESLILIAGTISFFWISLYLQKQIEPTTDTYDKDSWILLPAWKSFFFVFLGLGLLLLGAHWLVNSAQSIAALLGWDEGIAGLLIVALGTSLPELAACIAASIRKESNLLIGSIIGSNIFNVMVIPGLSFLFFPGAAPDIDYINLWIMLFTVVLLVPLMLTGGKLSRPEGVLLSALYLSYVFFLL